MASDATHAFWPVVCAMADLIVQGYHEWELTEPYVKAELLKAGFAEKHVSQAVAWVEKAVNSGTAGESLAMLQDGYGLTRVSHPLERVCFSKRIWTKIELCRHKGVLSSEVIERMLEGARVMDTRDWDDDEVSHLLAEIFTSIQPGSSETDFFALLNQCTPHYYC